MAMVIVIAKAAGLTVLLGSVHKSHAEGPSSKSYWQMHEIVQRKERCNTLGILKQYPIRTVTSPVIIDDSYDLCSSTTDEEFAEEADDAEFEQ